MRQKLELDIQCTVTNYIEPFPSYGVYSDEDSSGFYFDRQFYRDTASVKNSDPDSLGAYDYELKEGTVASDWQSGVDERLTLGNVAIYKQNNSLKWIAKYNSGNYFVNDKSVFLSSDYSCHMSIENEETELIENYNIYDGRVAIWKRDPNKIKRPWRVFEKNLELSNPRFQSYDIAENKLKMSKSFWKDVGSKEFDKEFWEYKGRGNSKSKFIFSNYFPLSSSNFRLIAIEPTSNTIIEFKESDNILMETTKDYYYEIDRDLGIIKIGYDSLEKLVVKEDVNSLTETIPIFSKIDLESYPQRGYLISNGTEVYYEKKGYSQLEGVVFSKGKNLQRLDELELIQKTFNIPEKYEIYIAYRAVPRFDFEVYENSKRTANLYTVSQEFLNLKPSANYYHNAVVQIDTMERHVKSLELEIQDGVLIGENYYGEIIFNIPEVLKATALNSNEEGVEDVEVTFVIESGPGFIDNGKSGRSITNSIGEAYVGFYAPYSFNDIRQNIVSYTYNQNETIFKVGEMPATILNEEIQLFQVLKIDSLEGTVGSCKDIVEKNYIYTDIDGNTLNKTYIKIDRVYEDVKEKFESGWISIQSGTSNEYFEERIESIAESKDYWVVFLKNNYNSGNISIFGTKCFLREKYSEKWSANSRNGMKRLVYKWNENTTHPISKEKGSYYPLRPASIVGNSIHYNVALRQHDPYFQEEYLGDYIVVSPRVTTIYAYCTDPFSGDLIVSNRIKLKISLPRYLNGVDFTESLPVPYGFRFKDEYDIIASGIGGKTFLTVNPEVANKLTLNIKGE